MAQTNSAPSSLIKTSIIIDSSVLSRQKQSVVTVTIENISGRELDFKPICSFQMSQTTPEAIARKFRVFGDSYWAPVNLLTGLPLDLNTDPKMLEKGVVVGRVPKTTISFKKDEIKKLDFDLTKLRWNASMGNDWPRWNLFEAVPKGKYSLEFAMQAGGDVKSNKVEVVIE